ncbi:MAG: ATP-binding protein [Verrucomicrobiota bacterium]
MKLIWQSIQWRIFAYYTLLIGASVLLLLFSYRALMVDAVEQRVKGYLQARAFGLFPLYFSPANLQGEQGPRGREFRGGPHDGPEGRERFSREHSGPPERDRLSAGPAESHTEGQGRDRARLEVRNGPLGPPGRGNRESGRQHRPLHRMSASEIEDTAEKEGWFFAVVGESGKITKQSRTAPDTIDYTSLEVDRDSWEPVAESNHYMVGLMSPGGGYMVFGKPRSDIYAEVADRMGRAYFVAAAVFTIVSFLGFWIIKHGLSPISKISRAAQKMAEGEISGRIDVGLQRSELGELAGVLNGTFDRLETLIKQQVQFTADASHDLRTPIAAILADCQFSLKKPRTPERYVETIEVCHESAQHMRMLVDQLGLLARYDANDSEMAVESVDLLEEIDSVCHVLKPVAEDAGIYLGNQLNPAMVQGDPLRLRQVWLNLLNNALSYTGEGGHVKVRCGRDGQTVWLEVADDGIGIPPEALDHIFDRFYRVDESRSVKTGGTGLGLAICKTIIEAHEGSISVQSEVGKGTCFRIELPAAGF